jgi:hypothetical protein
VLYVATDIIGALRYPGYHWLDQQFSELTAQESPVRSFMVIANVIPYTLLVVAFAVGVWLVARPRRAARFAAAGMMGYAVFGVAGGLVFPMHSREALEAGERGLRNAMYGPATLVMSLCLMIGMGFAAALFGRRFRIYTSATIVALVSLGSLVSLQIPRLEVNDPTPWMGLAQRGNIYATMLWMTVLAVVLLRAEGVTFRRWLGTRRMTPQPA